MDGLKEDMETIKRAITENSHAIGSKDFISTVEIHDRSRGDSSTISMIDFSPPANLWCPWRSDSCTRTTQRAGQVTVVMEQEFKLPFELYLSSSNDPLDKTYQIHLAIDTKRVKISKIIDGVTDVVNETIERDLVMSDGKNRYWLSVDYVRLFVKYGQGEVRDRCTLLKSPLSEKEMGSAKNIHFAHVSFSGSRMLNRFKWYKDRVKLKVGPNSVVQDPPLLVVEPKDFTVDQYIKNSVIPLHRMDAVFQALYYDTMNWKFQDDSFPHFFEAVERSMRNESGWCYKKLEAKSAAFGVWNPNATFLRIIVAANTTTSTGIPYVLELWPPGHFTPIHAHSNSYGIIRVIYGEINLKIYRTLSLEKQIPIHQMILSENQVTWLSPGLNQVHQLENKSPDKSCITVQAYQYVGDEISNYESIHYINNNGLEIDRYDPISDIDYSEFKKIMMAEWNNHQ